MSIQVGVRVRLFNIREKDHHSECIIEMPGENQTRIKDENGKKELLLSIIVFGLMMVIMF